MAEQSLNPKASTVRYADSLEWRMAWRHLRIGELRPKWPKVMTYVATFLLVVGIGFATYAGMMGLDPETAESAGYLPGELLERQHSYGILAAISLALGAMILVFASLAQIFNLLATVITMSVLLGCMNLVVVLSLMSGLEQDLRDKILNQKAHIRVSSRDGSSFSEYESVVDALAQAKGVVGVSPFVRGEVALRSGSFRRGGVLLGIDPARLASVSNLSELVESGSYESLDNPQSVSTSPTFSVTRTALPWRLQHLRKQIEDDRNTKGPSKLPTSNQSLAASPTGKKIENREEVDPNKIRRSSQVGKKPIIGMRGDDLTRSQPRVDSNNSATRPSSSSQGKKNLNVNDWNTQESEDWEDPMEVLRIDPNSEHEIPVTIIPAETDIQDEGPDRSEVLDAVLMGRELVKELGARVGSRVQLITPDGRITPAGRVPGVKDTVIGGIFYSGMYQYDQTHIYAPLPTVQAFLRRQGRISGIEIKLEDLYQTDVGKQRLQAVLTQIGREDELMVETWAELNRNLFAAMFLEKIAMFVALLFVVLVASFGVLASNLMSVLEKAKEIAILKAMGSTDALIRRVFIAEGCCMGMIGVIGGVSVGLAMCWALDRFGFPLSENAYSLDRLPVVVNPLEVFMVSLAAMLIVWASSLYPAHVASRTRPVEGLRQSES